MVQDRLSVKIFFSSLHSIFRFGFGFVFNHACFPLFNIRFVFTTFKIKKIFNVKDAVPEGLRT